MLIDTHAHVNFRAFKDDAKEVLQRALDSGMQVINIGSQIDTSRQCVELANQFSSGVYAVVGLHPEHTHSQYVDEEETHFKSREENFDYGIYKELAQNPKVVGIGECGLDYFRLPDNVDHQVIKDKQKEAFRAQIKLAEELDKALIVHSRSSKGTDDAVNDILDILDRESGIRNSDSAKASSDKQELRFVVHSYTGSPEMLSKFLELGGYVSFNGIITFDKTGNMEKLVKLAPLDRILLETDCPYLTPVPNRGKRNEPQYVQYVAQKVAELRSMAVEEVIAQTARNAGSVFQIGVG